MTYRILNMRWILIVALFIVSVLGYGYWHVNTHGTLNISIYDASQQSLFIPLKNVEISMLDSDGGVLATGRSDPRYGTIHLSHPVSGSCADTDRNAWQACFRNQSTWLMEWIDGVRFMDIDTGACRLERQPVDVSVYMEEWWLWWVPLPHVGGRPYTYFRIQLRIDPITCKVIN